MTPEELRKLADELDTEAAGKARAGDKEGAGVLWDMAEEARRRAGVREEARRAKGRRLPADVNKRTVNSVLSTDHRVAISRARAPKSKLADYAQEAKLSMRDLAKAVGKSVALLSMAAAGKRTIKADVAAQIQRLTRSKKYPAGFAATRANWPKLQLS